jgi:flagellar biosynthesis GTPase FlhF
VNENDEAGAAGTNPGSETEHSDCSAEEERAAIEKEASLEPPDDAERRAVLHEVNRKQEVAFRHLQKRNEFYKLADEQDDVAVRLLGHADKLLAEKKLAALEPTTPRRVVTAAEFFAERDEALASLWGDGILVRGGGYLILSGPGGVGKTILLGAFLLALAAGRDEFLGFPLPGEFVPCLILEAEGSRSKFRERAAAMARAYGLDAGKLPLFFHA